MDLKLDDFPASPRAMRALAQEIRVEIGRRPFVDGATALAVLFAERLADLTERLEALEIRNSAAENQK